MSQQTIKKSSDMKSKLEDVILGGGSARNEFLSRRKQGSGSSAGGCYFPLLHAYVYMCAMLITFLYTFLAFI